MTDKTKRALTVALVDAELADEVETLQAAAAPISDKLDRHLEIALADLDAKAEVKAALEAGTTSVTRKTHRALAIAVASNEAALDLFTIA